MALFDDDRYSQGNTGASNEIKVGQQVYSYVGRDAETLAAKK